MFVRYRKYFSAPTKILSATPSTHAQSSFWLQRTFSAQPVLEDDDDDDNCLCEVKAKLRLGHTSSKGGWLFH